MVYSPTNLMGLVVSLVALGLSSAMPVLAEDSDEPVRDIVEWGREIAYGSVGNCQSCHVMSTDGSDALSGNIGPILVAMRTRYSNIEELKSQIYNASAINPNSIMPPFGTNLILTEEEIEAVTVFVWGL